MTVRELIKTLEAIEDKDLPVVADIGLDFCDRQYEREINDIVQTEFTDYDYIGAKKNRVKKCIKLVDFYF